MLSAMNESLSKERQPRRPEGGAGRLKLIFTLDYEIHGNGEGSPLDLMVSPTNRLLDILEAFGAKLTIMADTVEILKFREYRDSSGRDDWSSGAITPRTGNGSWTGASTTWLASGTNGSPPS
jgi:hypothetical protein